MCTDNPATTDALALPRDTRTPKHRKALHHSRSQAASTPCGHRALGTRPSWRWNFSFSRQAALAKCGWPAGMKSSLRPQRRDMDRPGRSHENETPAPCSAVRPRRRDTARGREAGRRFRAGVSRASPARPLSDMTLSKLVKELGFDADVHGFRTSFRTWAQEQTNFPREVAEAALAHKVGDAVEQAYARSDVFEKRRKMMERWSKYACQTDLPTKVVVLEWMTKPTSADSPLTTPNSVWIGCSKWFWITTKERIRMNPTPSTWKRFRLFREASLFVRKLS